MQTIPGNVDITPVSRGVGAIDPDNTTSLNANTNFVSQAGMVDLVAEPLLTEWCRFIDLEVCTIHSHQTESTHTILVSILPLDLNGAE